MNAEDFDHLRRQLKLDEGLRLFPYLDSRGKITIGYGRNLTDRGIHQLEAEEMLSEDIDYAWSELAKVFPVVETLDNVRQSVLTQMCFNLGPEGLRKFPIMWLAVARGDFKNAAEAMLNSKWATEVGARATRLADEMASGELK